ncbi:MAG: hypothetical protein ACRELE_11540 [Gemmatimonadales bacterium]
MMVASSEVWINARTQGAPVALRLRVQEFFVQTPTIDLATRLSDAGRAALGAAMGEGADRAAALDLLAADALITLALLAGAERDPASLGSMAAQLRVHASTAVDHPPCGPVPPSS